MTRYAPAPPLLAIELSNWVVRSSSAQFGPTGQSFSTSSVRRGPAKLSELPAAQLNDATGAPKTPSSGLMPSPGPVGTSMCPLSTTTGFVES